MKKVLFAIICLICANANAQTIDSTKALSKEEQCFDKGYAKMQEGAYPQALYWFEKGIETSPVYEENYYGATKVYLLSTETVWGVMYGELFMLISQNDSLKKEISKALYDTYYNSFTLNGGKSVADFENDVIVYSDSFERHNLFGSTFNDLMSTSAKGVRIIDIASLSNIRLKFFLLLKTRASDFMNPLFDYWQKIIDNGHWQTYNYWLFAYGHKSESATWARENKQKWNSFQTFLKKNPISLSNSYLFSRYQME
jgi:hypothetical protein